MDKPTCNHCGGIIQANDRVCPSCHIPLSTNQASAPQRKFKLFFIVVVIFCFILMYYLPPDWLIH